MATGMRLLRHLRAVAITIVRRPTTIRGTHDETMGSSRPTSADATTANLRPAMIDMPITVATTTGAMMTATMTATPVAAAAMSVGAATARRGAESAAPRHRGAARLRGAARARAGAARARVGAAAAAAAARAIRFSGSAG